MTERDERDRTPPEEPPGKHERDELPEPPPFDPDLSLIGDMEKLQRPLRREGDNPPARQRGSRT